ncbi:TrkA family potassium uptake protein [Acidithiobacillus montserratensis]|uniref:TrkA family potassium uptake protein n=1 Tax=Acidithiobacillus montserratensis TaxID=2729135 RepID=A0ACD5HDG9_9PROT|nr:TrkA family potassium uptake protein [Acidithiobacillus montserratensis]MBN2680322.1 TrkA family potassium uptake protein [Acidithiobacillaceae bacterium]MBU2748784.1 TrkA family potassium uptake protein [Acidithiobacillus montserratensis]
MRVVFAGASNLVIRTVQQLNEQTRHDIIIIENDAALIDSLNDQLDAAFIQGDASLPAILKEANPSACDFFFATTNSDESNMIAALTAKALGFSRVVVLIKEESYEPICQELGLDEIIIPLRAVRRNMINIIDGERERHLSDYIRADLRLFSFRVPSDAQPQTLDDLALPKDTKPIVIYDDRDTPRTLSGDMTIQPGDDVVLLTHKNTLKTLENRFSKK